MLVDFIPIIDGIIADDKIVQLPSIPDHVAYDNAHNYYKAPEFVESRLDGQGWIAMMTPGSHGMIRYRQEPNASKE